MLKHFGDVMFGVVFSMVLIYAHSAQASADGSSAGCSPRMLQGLARVYMAQGEYDKAETLVDKALDIAETQDAADEEESSCLIDLAWVYKNQGRFAEAEESCVLGLKLQQESYYSDHPYVAYTLRILASIFQARGKYDQAGAALDKAMVIIRKCHSEDDPVVASFEVRLEEAETEYERAIRIISDYYGPEHLYTANVFADIAKLYYLQGRYEQAEQVLSWATSIQQKIYGEGHHLLIDNCLMMARISRARGDIVQAERLLAKSLAAAGAKLGDGHPLRGEVLEAMAELYLGEGRYAEAEAACREAIGVFEKSVGPDSDLTAMAMNCLAKLQIIQGNFAQGYKLACSVLTKVETVFGPEHPRVAAVNETIMLSQELETVVRLAASGQVDRQFAASAIEALGREDHSFLSVAPN